MAMPQGVRIDILKENNYATWAPKMKALMQLNKLWEFVQYGPAGLPDGVEPTVSGVSVEPIAMASSGETVVRTGQDLVRDGQRALALIQLYVDNDQFCHVEHTQTAQEAWQTLRDAHRGRSAARAHLLNREFSTLIQNKGESVAGFFGRAMRLRSALRETGVVHDDAALKRQIMAGLDKEIFTKIAFMTDWADMETVSIGMLRDKVELMLTAMSAGNGQAQQPAKAGGALAAGLDRKSVV